MGTQSIGGKPQATSLFLRLAMFLGLFLSFGVATAFAASSYTVTEASATVGTATNLEIEYTVDAAVQTWADADTLTVTLPDNFPAWGGLTYAVEFDDDANNDGFGESALAAENVDNAGEYAAIARTLTIDFDQTTWTVETGDTIRILVTDAAIPTYEDATSTFTFAGATAAGGDTNPSGTDDVDVNPADAAGALALGANAVVGTAGNATLTLTLPLDLAATDTIVFTAPANLDVNSVAHGSNTFGGAGSFACADAGQVITCTADGAITAGTATIVMSGITSKYVAAAGNIADLTVNNVASGAGADFATDAVVAVTATTVGALTGTNVEPGSLAILTYSTNTISFTTTATIPNLGKIKVTYPAGWDVSAVNGDTAGSLSGLDGTWTASVSGQVITLTQTGGTATAAGAKSFTLEEIQSPGTTGSGGTYTILTEIAAGDDVQTATVTADTLIGRSGSSSTSFDAIAGFAVTQSDAGVLLTWDDPSDSSTLIQVLKGTGDAPVNGTAYHSVALGVEEYLDTNVEEGETYKYKIRGTDGSSNGTSTDTLTIVYTGTGGAAAEVSEEEVAEEEAVEDTATEETGDQAGEEETAEETDVPFSESGVFTDLVGHWAAERIQVMADAGIVHGDPNGEFRPNDSLNRAEAAALLNRVLGLGEPAAPAEKPFSDVEVSTWYAGYVSSLKGLELVNGNPDGTYKPAANINRAEFLHLALNVYYHLADADVKAMIDGVRAETTNPFLDVTGDAYYVSSVRVAHQMEFVEGADCNDGKCFSPAADITRAEATKILYEMFFAVEADAEVEVVPEEVVVE